MDAFRVNKASAKVDLRYRYTTGQADPAILRRLWSLREPEYDEKPDYDEPTKLGYTKSEVVGRWSCDGAIEYYDFATPDWLLRKLAERKVRSSVTATEALYGESTLVGHHYLDQVSTPYLLVWDHEFPAVLGSGTGPFLWWGVHPFPQLLDYHTPGANPEHRTSQRDGHPVEVEIYEHEPGRAPGVIARIEVSYDPSVGYLPRYARTLYIYKDKDEAHVTEMYMIETRRCSAGGFVPTEWYDTGFIVSGFTKRYPKYNDDTFLEPSQRIRLGHFKATEFKDRSAPVGMERLEGVQGIMARGQVVAKLPRGIRSLTMADLKAIGGRNLTHLTTPGLPNLGGASPSPSGGPTLDTAELNQFSPKPRQSWPWYLGLVTLVVFLCALVVRRRFAGRFFALLVICCGAAGCTRNSQPPLARLSAHFAQNHVLFDVKSNQIPLKLVVRNEGNQALQLRGADGGCSCRRIDQSKFPSVLKPGENVDLDTVFSSGAQYRVQNFLITFDTDLGPIRASSTLLALPRHRMTPDAVFTTIQEGRQKDWQFELVHRAIFRGDEPGPVVTLDVPPNFSASKVGSHSEAVSQAPELQFKDTTYSIVLRDDRLGMYKSPFTLRTPGGEVLLEMPVTWHHVPFLSSIPERVSLGTQPIRVFLRCPDEHIELTRVIAKPAGIKAVISSLRELTVMLDEKAGDVIDGQIEVGTTAPGRPSLKIPVVRYAPSQRTAALAPNF